MDQKNTLNVVYETKEKKRYPLEVIYKKISSDQLFYDPENVRAWCKTCSNFNKTGGCPPRAPLFEEIMIKDVPAWLIAIKFYSEYKPESIKKLTNIAMHWKFQDAILARLLSNFGHRLVESYGGTFLASGYCMGCPGKKCSFKLGQEFCRNSLKRTYSMEATGLNVVKSVESLLSEKMYWYKRNLADIPYMLKCMLYIPEIALEKAEVIGSIYSIPAIK